MPIEHLPPRMRPKARRFRDWLATDKGIILILAVGFACRALSYLVEAPRLMQHALDVQGWVSPAIWIAGTVLLVCALRGGCRDLERMALSFAVGVCALWSVMYFFTDPLPVLGGPWPWPVDWLRVTIEHIGQWLIRGSMYAMAAALAWYTVWRDSHGGIRVRGDND